MNKIKDLVRFQVYNKHENKTYVKDEVYERPFLEKWVARQREESGTQFIDWEILEV